MAEHPATLSIRAKAVDLGGDVTGQTTRGRHGRGLAEIAATIAAEPKPTAPMSARYRGIHACHIDQRGESGLRFLARSGRDQDALVSLRGGTLRFMPCGLAEASGGIAIPPRSIRPVDTARWTRTTRQADKSLIAPWHDQRAAQRREVRAGDGGPAVKLRHVRATEDEAAQSAKAKLGAVEHGRDTLAIVMQGAPAIAAGVRLLAAGVPGRGEWSVARHLRPP